MNLKIYMDGDMVCALLGENIQEGIAGFGGSVTTALIEWSKSWENATYEQKEPYFRQMGIDV